ncbi:DOPA 4,5-dioxygenase family protein [Porphyrobacter sp. AAP82]|uniref:DOPA 4,5-dioxygenase family protein n=1 Tax=Porphyrobacter sp. AAP82 TaxID=1248917 RepID=UPI0002F360DA|nr:DOPA 4,5-dioxygenase family protein [Porphyrobacter sp. AAP82]
MQNTGAIRGFHAHIYYDADEVETARAFAERARAQFKIAVGHFHLAPVGPHPRGSCQLSMAPETFAAFTLWALHERGDLTIFAHGLSGNDLADHTRYVVWLGPSEPLDLSIFG